MAIHSTPTVPSASTAPLVRRLVLGNLMMLLLVTGLLTLVLYRSYHIHSEEAQVETQNMARMLALNVSSLMGQTDVTLQSVALEVQRQSARGAINADTLNRFLVQQRALVPALASLRIADAQGAVTHGVEERTDHKFSVADRDYFLRVRDDPLPTLVIGDPVLSRITQKWTVLAARRLTLADGSFAGIVFAGITTDYFQSQLTQLGQGRHWALGLHTSNMRLIARHPWGDGVAAAIGGDAISAPLRQALQADPDSGTTVATAPVDQLERRLAYVRLKHYPLYAIAGQTSADYLSAWRQEAIKGVALTALALLAILGASLLVWRSWQRQLKTERARAKEAYRNQLLMQTAGDGIHILDNDWRLIEVNDAFCSGLGYTRDELLGMNIAQIDADLGAENAASIRRGLLTGKHVFETRHRRKDGGLMDVEVSVTQIEFDSQPLVYAAARNISERKRAEAEQRRLSRALQLHTACNQALIHAQDESQLLGELCRLVVETGGYLMAWVGVAEQDANKSVRPVAQAGDLQAYLDGICISWDAQQAAGRGPTGTALRTGTTQVTQNCLTNPLMAPWRAAIRQRGYQSSVALPLIFENQCLGALTIYATEPQTFGQAEVQLLEALAGDMAFGLQSLRARRELAHYQLRLEERVAQRTQEIDGLNRELQARVQDAESANRAKSTFLATMSHELRTPLNAVIGLTGLLADSPLGRRQRDYASKIQLSAQALRTLIDNILDFSKIEAGELQLEQAPFSLNAILRTTAAIVGVGLGGKPVEALFDVAPDVPDALIGDALRLQQILLNLTGNAVKFTQTGAIVVSVRCLARDELQEAREVPHVTLQFAVRDTGIGIPRDQLEAIFGGFIQADNASSRHYGGTGLGLAISARLARLMGGEIKVDSALNWGSEFRFSAPLAPGPKASPAVSPVLPASFSILIVDNHGLARDLLTQACARFGWQATAVDSGAAGLEELRRSAALDCDYDLLLLDWRMPGMDGLEMLRQAGTAPDFGLPLVVLMTSIFDLEQAAAVSDDLYLDGIVAKPITPDSLLEAVTQAYTGEFTARLPRLGRSDRRLAGMRLLVAEDNELNQEVIEQILKRAGAEVVIAVNGLAAVAALKVPGARFDAVLMDIQMPVLDGYSATRIIREELGLRDLPIIAVTAFARPEDREKSRLAGMVGHIVKPLDVEDLLDFVAKERQQPKETSAVNPDPDPTLILAGLEVANALKEFGKDRGKYLNLLRKFVTLHGGDADEARRLFSAGNPQGAAELLHGLRGVASILQASELAHLAAAAEGALQDGRFDLMPLLFDELQAAMRTLEASVNQLDALWAGV